MTHCRHKKTTKNTQVFQKIAVPIRKNPRKLNYGTATEQLQNIHRTAIYRKNLAYHFIVLLRKLDCCILRRLERESRFLFT